MSRSKLSFILIFLVSYVVTSANGANILGVFTSHSPSHVIVHQSIANVLAERGHNVTVVVSDKPKIKVHKDITVIVIPPTKEEEDILNKTILNMVSDKMRLFAMLKTMVSSMSMFIELQAKMLKDPRFTVLYDNPDTKFDLVICGFFFNTYQLGVAAKFKAPVIVTWTSAPMVMVEQLVGSPTGNAALMGSLENHTKFRAFLQRAQNFFASVFFKIMNIVMDIRMRSYYNDLFQNEDENFPSLHDMYKNVSLVFCNSHFSEASVNAHVPALVEIGGIQVKDKPNPLPKDIADFLNSANKTGAIFFSLGSNFKGSNITPEKATYIFNVLSKLKEKVIWKWEDLENTPGNAPNILYQKWLPQDDILAHPNTKLFITHAGKGGIAEAQYHGVPMLAMPIFGDQHQNAQKMVQSGYGQMMPYVTLTEAEFKSALLEVLNNPKYRENVQGFSRLYRDRPLSARETAAYWVEYVLRHHGARHMQSPLVHMNFIEATNLDVYCFLCLIIYALYKIIRFSSCLICRKIFKKIACPVSQSKKMNKVKQQ